MTPLGWAACAVLALGYVPARPAPARLGALAGVRLAGSGPDEGRRGRVGRLRAEVVAGPAVALAATATWIFAGPAICVASTVLVVVVTVLARDVRDARAAARRRADLLAAVRVLVAELNAGARPGAALTAAGEVAMSVGAVFAAAARAADDGRDAAGVLAADANTRSVGVAWALGQDVGVALSGVLGRVAADLCAADDQRRVVAVALAGPRSSAAVLAGLPLVGIAMGAAMGASPASFLLGSPAGRLVCGAGVLLDAAGVLWMRRILRSAERGP